MCPCIVNRIVLLSIYNAYSFLWKKVPFFAEQKKGSKKWAAFGHGSFTKSRGNAQKHWHRKRNMAKKKTRSLAYARTSAFATRHHGSCALLAPGAMLFGAAQFLLCLAAAEALFPGYSVSKNAISDLGVGITAPLFSA